MKWGVEGKRGQHVVIRPSEERVPLDGLLKERDGAGDGHEDPDDCEEGGDGWWRGDGCMCEDEQGDAADEPESLATLDRAQDRREDHDHEKE